MLSAASFPGSLRRGEADGGPGTAVAQGRLSRNPPQRGQAGGTEAKRGQSHGFGVPWGRALPCSERWPWGCPGGGQSSKGRAGRCLAPKGWKSSPHAKAHTALELGRVSFAPRCRAESRNLQGSAGFASSAISGGGRVAKTLIFPHFGVREGGAQEAEPCSTAGGGCALPPLRDLGSGLGLFRAVQDCWGTSD